MFKALLAAAIATSALSGPIALAAPASRAPQATNTASVMTKETKTTAMHNCRDHKGKFVKCAKSTRTTASVKTVKKAH